MAAGDFKLSRFSQLICLLGSSFLVATAVHVLSPFHLRISEYGFPAEEFAHTHRISSVFLPIGFSSFVGLWIWILHSDVGLYAANLIIYLAWICVVWVTMQQLGATQRQSFLTALAFVFYPDTLLGLNNITHTTTTSASLFLLAFISCVIYLVRHGISYRADIAMAVVMGLGILVRPNYVPLFPLAWFFYWRFKLPHGVLRAAAQFTGALLLYVVVTTMVHGSPFWPQNGPYNLFQGANEYTEQALLQYQDAERSMFPALESRGIEADLDWNRPDNLPGSHDTRNLALRPFYTHEALLFIRTHPLTMVKLTGLKLFSLLRPDLLYHSCKSVAGMAKILVAFSLPLWLIAYFVLPRPGSGILRIIVPLTIITYIVPFLLTIGAPHFRTPLDILCQLELLAMIFAWRRQREAKQPSTAVIATA